MSVSHVTIERAAASPEEFAFIAAIADDRTDDSLRLVYADWLDDQGDPRGPLLRAFFEAIESGSDLPSLSDVPSAWADVLGLSILKGLHASENLAFSEQLLRLAQPAIRIEADEADFENSPEAPDEVGMTRLGGDPDLLAGSSYPTEVDGTPLHFLAQFKLNDFHQTVAGRAFPESGLLSIFRTQVENEEELFIYVGEANLPRLVRHVPDGQPLARVARPAQANEPLAPFRTNLRLVETLRLPGEFRGWPGVDMPRDRVEAFDDVFPTNLGGTEYVLLGHVTHGNTGEEPLKDRPDWVQLVLVPYFEGPDYGVTDSSLSYQIPAADLKAGTFERLESTFG